MISESAWPFLTALSFGVIALIASTIGAPPEGLTLIGTLAGYVLGSARPTGRAGRAPRPSDVS
jgi:hypothetical protein